MSILQPRLPQEPALGRSRTQPSEDRVPVGGPRSLHRMLGIFDVIARSPDGLSLAEISIQLESPKSSMLTLLRPLVGANYLVHANGRYSLGNESFALAANIISARKFGAVVRSLMLDLQKRCPETIILAVVDRAKRMVTYSDVLESPQLIRYSVPAGVSRPLYTSAAGQLLLAHEDEKWRDRYLRSVKLRKLTPQTITDVAKLRRKLTSVRESGVSISISEAVEGAVGVAAPIVGPDGATLAALLIAGPAERYAREGAPWSGLAREYAAKASRAVGSPRT